MRECSSHTMCPVSGVTCHLSRVTCHVSHVTCHMSHVKKNIYIYFFLNGKSGEASRSRVCYQRGLPRLVWIAITWKLNKFFFVFELALCPFLYSGCKLFCQIFFRINKVLTLCFQYFLYIHWIIINKEINWQNLKTK